jgi:hypothetical protein
MTACTQQRCTGRVVDGYCDVCGSPAGAAPFVPARSAAPSASPAPAVDAGLTAVRRGSGVPPRPNDPLMLACTQQACTGTIVDCYCDVCGSPAGAVPFVATAASAASPAPADEPGLTAVPTSTPPAPVAVDEEIPTLRIPRVKMPRQQLSTQEMTDPGAADPGAVDGEQVDREKAGPPADDTGKADGGKDLADEKSDGDQVYRTRIAEAKLPHDVRQAALCEVDKLERTSDQSPESGEIRTWLDTILDLPWSTKPTDWIDIQESREVEATLRMLIEPAVADAAEIEPAVAYAAEVEPAVADLVEVNTAEIEPAVADAAEVEPAVADLVEVNTAEIEPAVADAAEVEPAVADIEKTDATATGPDDADTVTMPRVGAVLSGGRHPPPQLPEQQVHSPPAPVQKPAQKKHLGSLALAAAILAALLVGALFFANRDVGGVTAQSVATVTATATMPVSKSPSERSDESTDTGRGESTIQLEDLAASASPFEPVRIQGMYHGGAGTFLRVQRWEEGEWLDFPLPTKTDESGRFITQADFAQPGRYRLRVLDPDSGVTSKTFVVVIKD